MITPQDIDSKQFATTRIREGYDQDEVDTFLDGVAADMRAMAASLAEARDRVASLERRNAQLSSNPTAVIAPPIPPAPPALAPSAEKILVLAQETADKHVAAARTEGDNLLADARAEIARLKNAAAAEAVDIRNAAVAEAERLKSDGVAEKQRVLEDLEARHSQVVTVYNSVSADAKRIEEALIAAVEGIRTRPGAATT